MKTAPRFRSFACVAALIALGLSACSQDPLESGTQVAAPSSRLAADHGSTKTRPAVLRHPQLLDAARLEGTAGKTGTGGLMAAFMGYDDYEADGVTRRVLDSWAVTRRVLDEYGVTRRVLDQFGVTRRVLTEYGVTRRVLSTYSTTNTLLDQYGITRRVMEQYGNLITESLLADFGLSLQALSDLGITPDLVAEYNWYADFLADYGVTRRILEEYAETFVPAIQLRMLVGKLRVGASVTIDESFLAAILEEIADDPDIAYLEPDPAFSASMPLAVGSLRKEGDLQLTPWNVDRVGGRLSDFKASNVHLFVLDSGVTPIDMAVSERKDFTMLFVNRDETMMDDSQSQDVPFFDPGTAGDPEDRNGHGTHVAATAAAITENAEGIRGVAPGVIVHSLKVLTDDGRTDMTTVIAALNYVKRIQETIVATGIKARIVVNMSFGMDTGSTEYNALDEAVAELVKAGAAVVVAAGNEGRDAATYSPAHVSEAITVGAFDLTDRYANFSNFGDRVDILAPGVDVVSLPNLLSDYSEGLLVLQSGTSMAAPHVAGAAAMFLELNPDANPAQVLQGLLAASRADILGAPPQTTNRSLYTAGFARDPKMDKPFALGSATWNTLTRELEVKGDAPRLEYVRLKHTSTGQYWGPAFQADAEKSAFLATFPQPPVVPCSMTAEWTDFTGNLVSATVPVTYAPATCDDRPSVFKAVWSSNKLYVEVEGIPGRQIQLRSANTGVDLGTATIAANGWYKAYLTNLAEIPCRFRAVMNGQTSELAVTTPPVTCDSKPLLQKAAWGSGKLYVEIMGTPGRQVTLHSHNTGTPLGSVTFDAAGWYKGYPAGLTEIPCALRATLNGNVASRAVSTPPANCDGRDYLTITKAEYSASKKTLIVQGVALAGRPGTQARIAYRDGGEIAVVTPSSTGAYTLTKTGVAATSSPCAVRVTLGQTGNVVRDVANRVSNCRW